MACVEFVVRLFKDKTFHCFHLPSEFLRQVNIAIFSLKYQDVEYYLVSPEESLFSG